MTIESIFMLNEFDENEFINEHGKQMKGGYVPWHIVNCCESGKVILAKWLIDNYFYYDDIDAIKLGFIGACKYGRELIGFMPINSNGDKIIKRHFRSYELEIDDKMEQINEMLEIIYGNITNVMMLTF